MNIDTIVQKRTDLMNFFLNEDLTYTKRDILNKEFAVLSFSPTEEYIDILHTPYDSLCVDISTYTIVDTNEVFFKGIIVDVDRQNFQTIIHIQNKETLLSITANGPTAQRYDDYFIVGEPIITKCKVYEGRIYLSMLLLLNNLDEFKKECNYLDGNARKKNRRSN